jgi:PPP family 3-phenylpropionic acid transporter
MAATPSGRDVTLRLSLLYAATFLMFGVQIPFLPVWLGSRGLDDRAIAFMLAAPQFLRVISTPLVAHWADKSADFLGVLTASLIFNAVLAFALIFVSGFAPIFVAVTLLSCGPGVAMPLTDALTFAVLRTFNAPRGEGARRIEYGRVRTWGSAAFVVGNIVAGFFLSLASAAAIPFELAAFGLVSIAAAFYAGPMRQLAHPAAPHGEEHSSARAPFLLIVIFAAAALIQASHALVNTFGSLHWAREGHSGVYVGAAWAIGVVCETLFFAFGGRWVAGGDRAASFLVLGGVTAILRWFVMAGDPGPLVLLIAQAGHGFSFAATHMGTMYLIFELAPHAMRARAQGWQNAASAGTAATAVMLSGPLYASSGEKAYLAMAGLAAAGVVLALFVGARRTGPRTSRPQAALGSTRSQERPGRSRSQD